MTNGQKYGLITVKPVESNVSAATEWDQPFAKFWLHMVHWTPSFGVIYKDVQTAADGSDRLLGRRLIFVRQKPVKAINIFQRRRRPNQLWHSGDSVSCPSSSRANQASASACVTCRPVSSNSSHAVSAACRMVSRFSSRSRNSDTASRRIQ